MFELSRDYERAWQLMQQGDRLACWVDCDINNRGIAEAFYQKWCLSTVIADRHHRYLYLFDQNTLENFTQYCTELNIEFYLPLPDNTIVIIRDEFDAIASKVIEEKVGKPLDNLIALTESAL